MKSASFILNLGFSLLLDAVAAGLISFVFGGSQKLTAFFVTFLSLALAPAFLGAWALLKFWISYAFSLKELLTRIYLVELNKSGMPSAAGHFDALSYLGEVAGSETEAPAVRIKAAVLSGELQAAATMKPFTMGIAAQAAFENAMSRYRAEPRTLAPISEKAMEGELADKLED